MTQMSVRERGNAQGQYELGVLHYLGKEVEEDEASV